MIRRVPITDWDPQTHPMREKMVGAAGFEPATPGPPDRCATGLRYAPPIGTAVVPPRTFWVNIADAASMASRMANCGPMIPLGGYQLSLEAASIRTQS